MFFHSGGQSASRHLNMERAPGGGLFWAFNQLSLFVAQKGKSPLDDPRGIQGLGIFSQPVQPLPALNKARLYA